ncbi:uncharacterized protein I206_105018 [Kwoniella pini CBS 10737]|uniref:Uncharacterized protein n=1 Tax=Kwoniella pini CBS 10737 TaxID=1296096 RepID=A0A1B9I8W5_9TREE|nr:uncharacterized protein I206_02557 [Kwoniella pini CBS 10737]OCF51841.1 hypothetical protein I206_02557 [Kwoniella pini CBS 10737]
MSTPSPFLNDNPPTMVMQDTGSISAYHASISQQMYSLLQAHNPSISSKSTTRSVSVSSSILPELPNGFSSRKSHKKSKDKEVKSLLDPNIQVEVLVNGEIKPDLLKKKNIKKIDNSSSDCVVSTTTLSDSSKLKDNISSIATGRSIKTNSIITNSQAESNSLHEESSFRGRSKLARPRRHVSGATIQANKGRYEYERSASYDYKRQLRFAKHRAELVNKVDNWWKEVQESLPEESALTDIPPEIPESIPSPSIPHAIIRRSSDKDQDKTSSISSSPSSSSNCKREKLPPLKLYDNFPSKSDQMTSPRLNSNSNSDSRPVDFLPSPSLGLGIGFAFNIEDPNVTKSITHSHSHTQQQPLTFSNKACKATFKCMNSKSLSAGLPITNKFEEGKEWIIDVLGKSADWDIPFDPNATNTKMNSRKNIGEERSRSPIKVLVTGEMPTPKPIAANSCMWGG